MPEAKKTSAALILAAWLIVGVPAAWGVYNTGLNAIKLFAPSPSAVPSPSAKK